MELPDETTFLFVFPITGSVNVSDDQFNHRGVCMSELKVAAGVLAFGFIAVGGFNRLRDTVQGEANTGGVVTSTCIGGVGASLTLAEAAFTRPGRYSVAVEHVADFGIDSRTTTYAVDVPKDASLSKPFGKGLDVWSGYRHIDSIKVEPAR